MGYSLSWAAVKNGTLEMICSAGSLRSTGQREEVPESNVVAAAIPTSWYAVLYNHSEISDQLLAKLSAGGEVVSCFVEDHVMYSSASGWTRGKQLWKVLHDCEKGRYHLEVTGTPPIGLADIQKRLTETQNDAGGERADVNHIYEIPAELAKALTGFRHDEDVPSMDGDVYQVLEPLNTDLLKKGLLSRLASVFKGKNSGE